MSCFHVMVLVTGGLAAAQAPNRMPPSNGQGQSVFLGPPVFAEDKVPQGRRDAVLHWNEVALQCIRADRTPPPLAARNLAVVHLAIFDAVNAIHQSHQPYLVETRAVPWATPEAAVAGAAHHALVNLHPRHSKLLDRALAEALAELHDERTRAAGVQLGQFVAAKYLEWRSRDGADGHGTYQPQRLSGRWQPTLPDHRPALLPQWGSVARFAIRKGTESRMLPPPRLDSEEYTAAFNEVKLLGGKHSRLRSQDQTEIALFWADDIGTSTPPGHWNKIAQDVARQRGDTLVANARLFALLNMSLAEAGILCWVCKFTFDLWRPVTAIRKADEDSNPATRADPCWEPLLETPPFPAYTSGHSTFSAAAAHVLAKFHGSDAIRFDSVSEGLPGVRRSYASFSAAAEEAGLSRIYGGIHWQFDNTHGLSMGRDIADHVCRRFLVPRGSEMVRGKLLRAGGP